MLVWSVVVGVAGAFATIAFRQGIELLQLLVAGKSGSFVEMARSLPWTVRIWLRAISTKLPDLPATSSCSNSMP